MSTSTPKIAFVPIARPTFDIELAQSLTNTVHQNLLDATYEVVGKPELVMSLDDIEQVITDCIDTSPDLLLVLQSTFADSSMIVQLVKKLELPLLMWALPEEHIGGRLRINSFCGINLAGHALTRAGYPYEFIYASPDDVNALEKVGTIATASMVHRRLQGTRIGRVGENPDGFETCLVNHEGLQETLGVEIVQLELETVFDRARSTQSEVIARVEAEVKAQVAGVDEFDDTATKGTLSTYITLNQIAGEQDLHGFAVRCWPEFFTDLGCSACGAMSMLSNNATPCSCEADVNGTITQLMLQWMSGEPAFGTDMVSFDVDEDIAILWHCGLAPLSMADPDVQPVAALHSNRKMPLLMQFPLKPGRITIARLSEATGNYRLVIGGGEMLKAPPAFTGTSGTIRFDSGTQAVMDTIMNEGLEHHVSITYGDYQETLLALAKMLKIPVLRL